MRWLPLLIVALFAGMADSRATTAAQPEPPRLIVRGDDMGYSHSGNVAMLRCSKEGIQTSIEVLVPTPWFPEAVRMLDEIPQVDVGIHLTLTSEWDNVKWRPVADVPSLRDADGFFFPMVRPNPNYPGRSVAENRWRIEDVEKEFRAQIELGKRRIPRASHLTGHMGCTSLTPDVRALEKRLAREYGLDIDPREAGVIGVRYQGPSRTSAEKIESFIKMLETLEPAKTYLFVDHPGLDTPELRAIHHIGYEDVAVDRQGVTDAWTSARVKAVIRDRGIRLIDYRDLKR